MCTTRKECIASKRAILQLASAFLVAYCIVFPAHLLATEANLSNYSLYERVEWAKTVLDNLDSSGSKLDEYFKGEGEGKDSSWNLVKGLLRDIDTSSIIVAIPYQRHFEILSIAQKLALSYNFQQQDPKDSLGEQLMNSPVDTQAISPLSITKITSTPSDAGLMIIQGVLGFMKNRAKDELVLAAISKMRKSFKGDSKARKLILELLPETWDFIESLEGAEVKQLLPYLKLAMERDLLNISEALEKSEELGPQGRVLGYVFEPLHRILRGVDARDALASQRNNSRLITAAEQDSTELHNIVAKALLVCGEIAFELRLAEAQNHSLEDYRNLLGGETEKKLFVAFLISDLYAQQVIQQEHLDELNKSAENFTKIYSTWVDISTAFETVKDDIEKLKADKATLKLIRKNAGNNGKDENGNLKIFEPTPVPLFTDISQFLRSALELAKITSDLGIESISDLTTKANAEEKAKRVIRIASKSLRVASEMMEQLKQKDYSQLAWTAISLISAEQREKISQATGRVAKAEEELGHAVEEAVGRVDSALKVLDSAKTAVDIANRTMKDAKEDAKKEKIARETLVCAESVVGRAKKALKKAKNLKDTIALSKGVLLKKEKDTLKVHEKKASLLRKIRSIILVSGQIASADSAKQVEEILRGFAAPVGSFRTKRTRRSYFTLNSYLGIAGGEDKLINTNADSKGVSSFHASAVASLGFEYGLGFPESSTHIGLYLQLVDLGNFLSYRTEGTTTIEGATPTSDTTIVDESPRIRFSDVFSPGLFLTAGLVSEVPVSFAAGVQFSPSLRKAIDDSNNTFSSWRWSISMTIDMPILVF